MNKTTSKRLLALDILRGITIAGMIMVNNPGSWSYVYAPLGHAQWNGLTPTDLVFPFFMFIMGISTYISLRKYNFEFSHSAALKIPLLFSPSDWGLHGSPCSAVHGTPCLPKKFRSSPVSDNLFGHSTISAFWELCNGWHSAMEQLPSLP